MYLDKKQLGWLIELQSIIKEKMGEWREGDYGYTDDKPNLCIYIYTFHGKKYIRLLNSLQGDYLADDERIIRLPAIIDPVNSERGLFGMLDWKTWLFSFDGIAFIKNEDGLTTFFDDDIVTVLLRALYIQEVLQKDPIERN